MLTTDQNGNWQSADYPGKAYFSASYPPFPSFLSYPPFSGTGYLAIQLVDTTTIKEYTYNSNSSQGVIFNNVADIFGNKTIDPLSLNTDNAFYDLNSLNYKTNEYNNANSEQIQAAIESSNVFYIHSIGEYNIADRESQFYAPNNTDIIESDDVYNWMITRKLLNQVPNFNFVFIDCNDSEGPSDGKAEDYNSDMSDAFGINNNSIDCAYLGWYGEVKECEAHDNWTKTVWDTLENGSTLSEAVNTATEKYPYATFKDDTATYTPQAIIIGDPNMRLGEIEYYITY